MHTHILTFLISPASIGCNSDCEFEQHFHGCKFIALYCAKTVPVGVVVGDSTERNVKLVEMGSSGPAD